MFASIFNSSLSQEISKYRRRYPHTKPYYENPYENYPQAGQDYFLIRSIFCWLSQDQSDGGFTLRASAHFSIGGGTAFTFYESKSIPTKVEAEAFLIKSVREAMQAHPEARFFREVYRGLPENPKAGDCSHVRQIFSNNDWHDCPPAK